MKAITQDRYDLPDVLEFCDVETPTAEANEILVRVQAASVNAADWHIMRGDPYLARLMMPAVFGRRGPKQKILGRDFAGRVEAVGNNVERFQVGDEVYGETEFSGGSLVGPLGLIIAAQLLDRVVRHRLITLSEKPSQQNLAALRELIESGQVTPIIDRTYALNEVPEAIRHVEQEHARAKVTITI